MSQKDSKDDLVLRTIFCVCCSTLLKSVYVQKENIVQNCLPVEWCNECREIKSTFS